MVIQTVMQVSDTWDNCYICEKECFITKHHIIPKRSNPEHNKCVGVCKGCHEFIHSVEQEEILHIKNQKEMIKQLNEKLRKTTRLMKKYKSRRS